MLINLLPDLKRKPNTPTELIEPESFSTSVLLFSRLGTKPFTITVLEHNQIFYWHFRKPGNLLNKRITPPSVFTDHWH